MVDGLEFVARMRLIMGAAVDLKECLAGFKTSLEELLAESWSDLNLDEHCRAGGSVDEVFVEALEFTTAEGETLKGHFHITFEESYQSGCRDIDWTNYFAGMMRFSWNFKTGLLEIAGDNIEQVRGEDDQ